MYKYLLLIVLFPFGALAIAPSDFYGRVDTGYSWSSNMERDIGTDAGSSAIVGAGLGYRVNDNIRTDVTLGYRGWYQASGGVPVNATTVNASADIKSFVGLVNAYYDIGHYNRFTPYVGGGIGFSNNMVDTTNFSIGSIPLGNINSHSNTSLAWQLGAGTAVDITSNLALDIGYRYIDMGTAQTGDTATILGTPIAGATLKGNLRANEVQVGLRYSF